MLEKVAPSNRLIEINMATGVIDCGGSIQSGINAVTKVESIGFNCIVDRAMIELASIGITDIYDMLTIDKTTDGFSVVCQIMKDTIDRFEYLEPFGISIYPILTAGASYEFIDNFKEYLEGKVKRSGLQLVPRVIVSIIDTYLGTLRGVTYEPPYIINNTYSGQYKVNIIANRPYVMAREGMRFTEDSVYYYLSENYKPRLTRFRQLFLVNLGKYIIRLNENLEHPNMPLNTFQGLVNYINELSSQVDELFNVSHGYYSIYSK